MSRLHYAGRLALAAALALNTLQYSASPPASSEAPPPSPPSPRVPLQSLPSSSPPPPPAPSLASPSSSQSQSWSLFRPVSRFWRWATDSDASHFSRSLLISPSPGLMYWPSLRSGLSRRLSDDKLLRSLSASALSAARNNDRLEMGRIANVIATVAYGKGISANDRARHLEEHGCATHDPAVLSEIRRECSVGGGASRGLVELGCGNGQWARKLSGPPYNLDVLAFDDMSAVPLNLALYHPRTKPNADFFFQRIRKGDESVLLPGRGGEALRGRVLLVVFPDPGPMAANVLSNYARAFPEDNDTFIYVGEGRGGANADGRFFDILEGGEWVCVKTMEIKPFGDKGFERFFIFKKVSSGKPASAAKKQ